MARRGRWSLLRRRGTSAGGLALLCVVLAVPAQAATPAPDPPPGSRLSRGAAGGADAARSRAQRPSDRRRRRSFAGPRRSRAPSRCQSRRRRRSPSRSRSPSRRRRRSSDPSRRRPSRLCHTTARGCRSLRSLRPMSSTGASSLLAGVALLLVALGGAVVARRCAAPAARSRALGLLLFAARCGRGAATARQPVHVSTGTAGANGWYTSNVTITWTVVDNGDLVTRRRARLRIRSSAEGTIDAAMPAQFTWGTVVSPPSPLT